MTEVKEGVQHREARRIVEFYLEAKERVIKTPETFQFPSEFIKRYCLGTRSKPNTTHTYDIQTNGELIEIDDLDKHSKKNQKINDGIATEYAAQYLIYNFYRLLKEEIANRKGQIQPDCASYLRKNLF